MRDGRDLFGQKMGLTLPLVSLHFVFFFLVVADPAKTLAIFAFQPSHALIAPWSFVTYQFLHGGPVSLFMGTLSLWILGSALEAEWGTGEFTVFWLVATLGGSLSAWAVGTPLSSDPFVVPVSMLFAYAFLFPDMQFLMFFVVPVKVKWIAWVTVAFLVWGLLGDWSSRGLGPALVRLAGASSGFLFFWARHHGKHRATKAARLAVTAVREAGAARADEALEKRNRALFPEVEELRSARRSAASLGAAGDQGAGGGLDVASKGIEAKLAGLVVTGVNVCKPVDFKGDQDLVCLRCEGFAECSLRYAAGAPKEISVRPVK
jgi:membrane associated rhomboid family serine protease